MLIGSDRYLCCPGCDTLMRQRSYASFNTFGTRSWSDGFLEGPGIGRDPLWTICAGCAAGLYVPELEVVGYDTDGPELTVAQRDRALQTVQAAIADRSLRAWLRRKLGRGPSMKQLLAEEQRLQHCRFPPDWRRYPAYTHSRYIMALHVVHYKHLLERGAHGGDAGKEESLRMAYWWEMNHPVRKGSAVAASPLEEHHQNLRRLEELLLAGGSPDLRIVAIRMELGRFAEAAEQLALITPREGKVVPAFSRGIDARTPHVFPVPK